MRFDKLSGNAVTVFSTSLFEKYFNLDDVILFQYSGEANATFAPVETR